jgi:hypothetical protein
MGERLKRSGRIRAGHDWAFRGGVFSAGTELSMVGKGAWPEEKTGKLHSRTYASIMILLARVGSLSYCAISP